MSIKKTLILVIGIPILALQTIFIFNIYSNHRSHKIISNVCASIKLTETIDDVFNRAKRLGLNYSRDDSFIMLNKNVCTCKLNTKNSQVIKKVSIECIY